MGQGESTAVQGPRLGNQRLLAHVVVARQALIRRESGALLQRRILRRRRLYPLLDDGGSKVQKVTQVAQLLDVAVQVAFLKKERLETRFSLDRFEG